MRKTAAMLASKLQVQRASTSSSLPTGSQRMRATNDANKDIKTIRVEKTAFK
jgi:hypothetical protein